MITENFNPLEISNGSPAKAGTPNRLKAHGEIMATNSGSLAPSKFTEEILDLHFIPSFDRGEPESAALRLGIPLRGAVAAR